ncbi:cytochrome c oxidase assembly protein [Dasania marina]|uniref:cytochrome c oxidase assembly protein n=1 Tax=Dasania marina TaxID=471499 RepID=UPI00036A785D|nr:cytochrome c oxidase assembly protein [Dasania marina]
MAEKEQTSIKKTVIKLVATVVVMLFFVPFVMVPLYDVLCEQLGINGKTGGRYEVVDAGIDTSRTITVQFVATINDQMPWQFRPSVTELKVHPGAINSTVFYAKNPRDYRMVAQAIPSLSPGRATEYFHKTECFCFNQQPLAAGAEADMPLQFIVDRDLPADIKTITLSYTIFDVTEMAKQSPVASR